MHSQVTYFWDSYIFRHPLTSIFGTCCNSLDDVPCNPYTLSGNRNQIVLSDTKFNLCRTHPSTGGYFLSRSFRRWTMHDQWGLCPRFYVIAIKKVLLSQYPIKNTCQSFHALSKIKVSCQSSDVLSKVAKRIILRHEHFFRSHRLKNTIRILGKFTEIYWSFIFLLDHHLGFG